MQPMLALIAQHAVLDQREDAAVVVSRGSIVRGWFLRTSGRGAHQPRQTERARCIVCGGIRSQTGWLNHNLCPSHGCTYAAEDITDTGSSCMRLACRSPRQIRRRFAQSRKGMLHDF